MTDSRRAKLRVLVVFAAAAALYLASMSPGVWWGDSAEMSRHARDFELEPVARGYPLHAALCFLAGRLAGDAAVGANLVSAVFGALAVALAYAAGERLGRRPLAGFAAAATLAFAHTFWQYSVVAEVYALHLALVLGAVILALHLGPGTTKTRVALGALLAVSGMLHHRMTVFAVPGIAYWAWTATPRGERGRAIAQTLLGVAAGCVPYVVLYAVAGRSPPADVAHPLAWRFDDVFLGGEQNSSYLLDQGKKTFAESAAYLGRFVLFNLPGPALAAAALGFFAAARREGGRVAIFLALLVAAHLWFPLRYDWTGDQYTFLVPIYPVAALAAGVGVAAFADRFGARAGVVACASLAAAPLALYVLGATTSIGDKIRRSTSDADRRTYFLPVRRGVERPDAVCAAKLERLPKGALLHCDWGDGEVYAYLQETRGLRQDVEVRIWHGHAVLDPSRPQWVSLGPYVGRRPKEFEALAPRLTDEGGGLFRLDAK